MTQITLTFTNLGNVQRGIRTVGQAIPGITKRNFKRAMKRAKKVASGGWSGGANYTVSLLPNQGYERTGNYGQSFKITEVGWNWRLESHAMGERGQGYTTYVGGNAEGEGQAAIHAGRWPLIKDAVMAEVERSLVQEIDADLTRVIQQEGLGL